MTVTSVTSLHLMYSFVRNIDFKFALLVNSSWLALSEYCLYTLRRE